MLSCVWLLSSLCLFTTILPLSCLCHASFLPPSCLCLASGWPPSSLCFTSILPMSCLHLAYKAMKSPIKPTKLLLQNSLLYVQAPKEVDFVTLNVM